MMGLVPREMHGDGTVKVPRHYNSDQPPRMALRGMQAKARAAAYEYGNEAKNQGEMPLRLALDLNVNAEAVKRLAEFFGLYDREEWDRFAKMHGLPQAPPPRQLLAPPRALPEASDTEPSPPPDDEP